MKTLALLFATLILIFGFEALAQEKAPPANATAQQAADWAKLPPAQWPQLVLTNNASFADHTPLRGASSFLIRMPDGEIMVGTAKHLIGRAGGVNPSVPLPDLDRVLTKWEVFPRTKADQAIGAKGLAEKSSGASGHDWLLLRLADSKAKLPATPLTPRTTPARIGETVYLIGVPYSDKQSSQNVYKGVVTARPRQHYFTYEFTPPVEIRGFSGAPIVDKDGLLLGHGVSMSEKLKQKDGLEIEFGGEDATLAIELWQHRDDSPPALPSDVLHLDLPRGWIDSPTLKPKPPVLRIVENLPLVAYCELVSQSKGDFAEGHTLAEWAKAAKAASGKSSKLQNRQETELHPNKVGDRQTLEYEITGQLRNVPIHYRVVNLERNGCFCKLVFWTTESHWQANQGVFDQVVNSLR